MKKQVTTIGIEIGIGAGNCGTKAGPETIRQSPFLPACVNWKETISPILSEEDKLSCIYEVNKRLAGSVYDTVKNNEFFLVVGGDHSCAMGTWSGVSHALGGDDFGLIWIDAHCDAHTFGTTHTGNIHGMPVATLLGHGSSDLTGIMHQNPKLKPENLVMIGIRDYEEEEHELLKSLGVKIFYNTDVHEQGIESVFQQALNHVRSRTQFYGVSFDLDGVDPSDIPAVGTPVPSGIDGSGMLESLKLMANDPQLIGYEIVEFNPSLDIDLVSEKYLCQVAEIVQPATIEEKAEV